MKIDRWKHYKKMCIKYGFIYWHILIILSPLIFAGLAIANILMFIGWFGKKLDNAIKAI